VAYSYLLLSVSSLTLIRAALKYRHIYRRQAALLLLAMPLPWVGNILYVFKWGPFPGQDLTPIGFGLTGLMLTLNVVQFSFLSLVPVARDALIENLDDGVLVLDARNRVADINPAARQLIGADASCLGKDVEAVWAAWPELAEICQSAMGASFEMRLDSTPPRYLDVHVSHLHDRRRRATGRLIVLRDITGRKQAEEERERLVLELQEALTNVKTLRGLLPICARCKKIRDDEGYWRNVEEYVKEHSEARFSHGICPDCMKTLYPWFKPGER
jgi:PAS domain S-box-containing protein